jgi:hypothetical protein
MSQIVLYRQYWMATLKDRHLCSVCGSLAINALEYRDKNGICKSISWFCNQDNPVGAVLGMGHLKFSAGT